MLSRKKSIAIVSGDKEMGNLMLKTENRLDLFFWTSPPSASFTLTERRHLGHHRITRGGAALPMVLPRPFHPDESPPRPSFALSGHQRLLPLGDRKLGWLAECDIM